MWPFVDTADARMIKQADLTATSLVETIQELMADPENLGKMAQSAYELGIRDASDRYQSFGRNHGKKNKI